MASEPSAAQRIRDSIAALPSEARQPWAPHRKYVNTVDGEPMARVDGWHGLDAELAMAAHIALLASPHVGEALANLLDILSAEAWEIWREEICDARDALEAAILRTQT